LIATRTPSFVAELMLQAQKLKKEMGDKPAPGLVARQWLNTTGELRLEQFKGKVVLLDFWGQWCAPCVKNLPAAEELHVKYKDKGLVVIGVHSADRNENLDEFLKQQKLSFPVMVDQGKTAERYIIETWPTYFLIDKAGKVSWGFGNNLPSVAQIEQLLKE
jgi:thiol-disulfide isomerase/thioredoxin